MRVALPASVGACRSIFAARGDAVRGHHVNTAAADGTIGKGNCHSVLTRSSFNRSVPTFPVKSSGNPITSGKSRFTANQVGCSQTQTRPVAGSGGTNNLVSTSRACSTDPVSTVTDAFAAMLICRSKPRSSPARCPIVPPSGATSLNSHSAALSRRASVTNSCNAAEIAVLVGTFVVNDRIDMTNAREIRHTVVLVK